MPKTAAAGYLAVAPAVYDRVQRDVQLGYSPDDTQAGMKLRADVPLDRALADIAAAAVARTAGKVGTVGYCWGGFLSAASAIDLQAAVDASVGYYGGGIAQALLDQEPRLPLMLHFGEQDHAIPLDDVEKIKAAWPSSPVYVYAGMPGRSTASSATSGRPTRPTRPGWPFPARCDSSSPTSSAEGAGRPADRAGPPG